ncbi:TRAP transporter large permease subunit, partial [Burkholderia cenocepacia]|uniref:TRAP transporter large permease subunit n=1 Tax=Burkholderia cenocepacia TaxID=95486 RepID=UPI0038CBFFB7
PQVAVAPRGATATWGERGSSLVKVLPVVGLLAALMGLLYSGVVSPTEVAGVGALLAIVLGVVMRRLTWQGFAESLTQTVRITVMIFALFIGAGLFGQFLTLARVPQQVVGWVGDLGLEPIGVLLLVALIYI